MVSRPVQITSIPCSGRTISRASWPFQITDSRVQLSSLSVR